jgi:hypothetical protein
VVAYADDVTVFLTTPQEAIQQYEKLSWAQINLRQSTAIPLGTSDTKYPILNIPYRSGPTILGTEVRRTIGERSMASWSKTTALLKKQAAEDYLRYLTFPQRISYVHAYLLSREWYTTQIYEPPEDCLRQILTTIARFIWRGEMFRVPLSTLYRPKDEGGLGW